MSSLRRSSLLLILFLLPAAYAQLGLSSRLPEERILAIVPMIGKGTADDPVRPKYCSKPGEAEEGSLGFRYVLSDDGRFAVIEFTFIDAASAARFRDKMTSDIRVFARNREKRDDVEREIRRVRSKFVWEDLANVPVPAEVIGGAK